jgi:hypothetical protein
MHGTQGLLVGLALFAIGFIGLGVATDQMMTHASPSAGLISVAGIGAYVLACLGSLAIIR